MAFDLLSFLIEVSVITGEDSYGCLRDHSRNCLQAKRVAADYGFTGNS